MNNPLKGKLFYFIFLFFFLNIKMEKYFLNNFIFQDYTIKN